MTDRRQELIGVGALVAGVFLGLTLLGTGVTGSWGRAIGTGLWEAVGIGAVLLPVLGIGWALAAFGRLGSLSALRAAALGAGIVLLLPYGVAIAAGLRTADLGPSYASWTSVERLAGLLPAFIAAGVAGAVGTAGGALAGLFALSALGILTVGWHPLVVLRQRERAPKLRADREREEPEEPSPSARSKMSSLPRAARASRNQSPRQRSPSPSPKVSSSRRSICWRPRSPTRGTGVRRRSTRWAES